MSDNIYDAAIIGAGASGLFCAVQTAGRGGRTLLIEKEKTPARKLNITGKGRCNVTNDCDVDTALQNLPRNPQFMYSALSRLDPRGVMDFFGELGVALKTERGNRVFPVSDNARDISGALINEARRRGVKFVRGRAGSIIVRNGTASGVICGEKNYYAKNIVVATGGLSYPDTGSAGDGYKLAESVGHTVTQLCGSLVPVEIDSDECSQAMGLSLRNCLLTVIDTWSGKKVFSKQGELLFTHFGMSGPVTLSASAHMNDVSPGRYRFFLNLKPALDEKTLDNRIRRDFAETPNRDFSNSLGRLLPSGIIPMIIKRSGISPVKKVNQITREERLRLCGIIQKLEFSVKGLRNVSEAIVTRGGVNVKEINPKTMESRLVKNLYFIGEVLDVDGYTGGFNLQIAFSTANACAQSIIM